MLENDIVRLKALYHALVLTPVLTARDASISACIMGYDVPRSRVAFKSDMTRSYAIILLCTCKEGAGPVLACGGSAHIEARERVSARTPSMFLPPKLFFNSDTALFSPLTLPPSSSNTRFFFASQSRVSLSSSNL